jgi:hypothetical protein
MAEPQLREWLSARFDALNERFDDMKEVQAERHRENQIAIRDNANATRALERDLTTVKNEITSHAQKIAQIFESLAASAKKLVHPEVVTLNRLKWYIACFLGGVATIVGYLKMSGALR